MLLVRNMFKDFSFHKFYLPFDSHLNTIDKSTKDKICNIVKNGVQFPYQTAVMLKTVDNNIPFRQEELVIIFKRVKAAQYFEKNIYDHLGSCIDMSYHECKIKTKSKKVRKIYVPNPELKQLQRRILAYLNMCHFWATVVHGYIPGRSIYTNAVVHKDNNVFLKVDIKNAFESTTTRDIDQLLTNETITPVISEIFKKMCFYKNILPIGAPSSPQVFNLISSDFIDKILIVLRDSYKLTVSRYADDITVSWRKEDKDYNPFTIVDILNRGIHNYELNRKKTRIIRNRCRVTGFVVGNGDITISRKQRRKWRAIIHNHITNRRRESIYKINGIKAFLHMGGYKVKGQRIFR